MGSECIQNLPGLGIVEGSGGLLQVISRFSVLGVGCYFNVEAL
jgi:hypothetical protein